MLLKNIPYVRQSTDYTCGPACLQMLFAMHGLNMSEDELSMSAGTTIETGTAKKSMVTMARKAGFKAKTHNRAAWSDIVKALKAGMPVLVNYVEPDTDDSHYALVVGYKDGQVLLHDPWNGEYFQMKRTQFLKRWLGHRVRAKDRGWMMTVVSR